MGYVSLPEGSSCFLHCLQLELFLPLGTNCTKVFMPRMRTLFCEPKQIQFRGRNTGSGGSYGCQVSNEKKTGYLGYIGDYTAQLYRDYNEPL